MYRKGVGLRQWSLRNFCYLSGSDIFHPDSSTVSCVRHDCPWSKSWVQYCTVVYCTALWYVYTAGSSICYHNRNPFGLLLPSCGVCLYGSSVFFHLWRHSELSAKIEYIKVRLERYRDLLHNTNTAENRDFQELRKGELQYRTVPYHT